MGLWPNFQQGFPYISVEKLPHGLPTEKVARSQVRLDLAQKRRKKLVWLKVARVNAEPALDPRSPIFRLELCADRLHVLGWHDGVLVRRILHAPTNDVRRCREEQEDRVSRQVGFDPSLVGGPRVLGVVVARTIDRFLDVEASKQDVGVIGDDVEMIVDLKALEAFLYKLRSTIRITTVV